MSTTNQDLKKLKQIFNKIFAYDKKKYHKLNQTINNSEFNYSNFAMWLGYRSPIYTTTNFHQKHCVIKDLEKKLEDVYKSRLTDNYFTPNYHISKQYNPKARRKEKYTAFLQDLWIDIDRTNMKSKEAKKTLYKTLDKLNIPKPHLVVNTSTREDDGARLQVHWLIDPIWIYDSQNCKTDPEKNKSYFKLVQTALINVLEEELNDWEFDYKPEELNAYARVPLCVHQTTKEKSKVLDFWPQMDRYNLEDNWCQNLVEKAKQLKDNQKNNTKSVSVHTKGLNYNLMELEQTKILLEGVKKKNRHNSQFALALICKHSGLSQKKAIEIIKEQNKKCEADPNDPIYDSQIKAVVRSTYRNNYGISCNKIAKIINEGTDYNVAADIRYTLASRDNVETTQYQAQQKYNKREYVIKTLLKYLITAYTKDKNFTRQTIAKETSLSYNTISKKQYWNTALNILENVLNIRVRYNQSLHTYIFISVANTEFNNYYSRLLYNNDLPFQKSLERTADILFSKYNYGKATANSPP